MPTRISGACNGCRSKKQKAHSVVETNHTSWVHMTQKCNGLTHLDRSGCTQCATAGIICTWPEQRKRGPAKGYIEGLEHRLHDAESLLLQLLPYVSQSQLRAATASLSVDRNSENEDQSTDKRASPPPLNKKTGIDYWDSFPLDTVENVRRWQNDCEVHTAVNHEPRHESQSQRSSPLVDSRPPSTDAAKTNRRQTSTSHRHSTSLEATAALQSFRLRQNPQSLTHLPLAQQYSAAASQDQITALGSAQNNWMDPSTFNVPQKQNTRQPAIDLSQFMDNWSQQTAMDVDNVGNHANTQPGTSTQDSQLNLFW